MLDENKLKDIYDDGNIPEIDLPPSEAVPFPTTQPVEPLPEYERPRKDGPGGE